MQMRLASPADVLFSPDLISRSRMDLLFKFLVFTLFISISRCYRLPTSIIPEHYKLEIITNLGDTDDKFEFSGDVWIKTTCVHPSMNVTLHSKNLEISKESIVVKSLTDDSEKVEVKDISSNPENDFLMIHFKKPLQENRQYEIKISYRGKLEDVLAGFYRSSYTDTNTNKTHYLATTQFESTDARRAFPCFDEPAMKATFEISLGHTDKYSALSNMPAIKVEPIHDMPGWMKTQFEKTVPMSTYLVAFIVSDFGYETSPQLKGTNVTFRIWSRKDALNQVQFAKDVGPKFLDYYEKFFDIKYPLPKQDMVAIPDFAAGAMENWGLITYREAYLLYDPEVSTLTNQESVASVIAHELAHQWFGNLVTMRWWTDLWLNEGFATYMAALAVHDLFPHWNSLEEESVDNLLTVFGFDSLKSSHAVSVPVGHPREIDEIFDTIAYKKGSYILRMMTLFLGEDTLRRGVTNYLRKHKFNNAEQDDLWQSLTEQAHKSGDFPKNLTVKEVMDTWTLQTGYPVVKVNRLYGKNLTELQQERFLRDNIKTSKAIKECWWVPISYTNENELDFKNTRPKYWLPCTNEKEVVEGFTRDDDKWLLINIEAAGLFRVNYDKKNWKMLLATLNSDNFKTIPVLNRVLLIDDSSYLSWTGDLNYEIFFDLMNYLKREEGYLPWKAALRNIGSLNRQLKRKSFYGEFKKYMSNLLNPIYEKVGALILSRATQQQLDAVKHQSQIASWACRFNVANCVQDARKKFDQYLLDPSNKDIIPKDLRSVIFCNALRHGGEKEWMFLWQKYLTSNVATEKNSLLSALGCTREIWLLRRFLEWTIKPDSGIRKQDCSSVFSSVAVNDIGFYIAQTFLAENIKDIYKQLSPNTRRLTKYLAPLASQMTSDTDYEWFKNLTESNEEYFKEAKQGVQQGLETIKLNIQWQKKHAEEINKLLEDMKE